MKKIRLIIVPLLWYILPVLVMAQPVIRITDFGARTDSHANTLLAVKNALAYCKENPGTTLEFPTGRYDFWPLVTDSGKNEIVFDLKHIQGLTVNGNGSEFIMHGWLGVARADSCSSLVMKNFSVDWDRPWISQGKIVNVTDQYVDVDIDRKEYPYLIENQRIVFLGEGVRLPVLKGVYNNLYDKDTKEIVYNTWDSPIGDFFDSPAQELANGLVRFKVSLPRHPESGTYVTFYHAHYGISGFVFDSCKDVLLKDLKIYHTAGNGVLGVRSENITMDNASMKVNDAKGRVFSTVADASHFSSCKGLIRIENCAHTGQGDDFINVHGRSVLISKIVDGKTLIVKTKKERMAEGDEVWFIDKGTAQRGEVRTIAQYRKVNPEEDEDDSFQLVFTQPLPLNVKEGDFIENKTWTPQLILRNCQILKRHRARGILFTTPRKVLIENNYFRTAGTAILIEGDMDFWLESGANQNVLIQHNVFEDCLTSGNAHGKRNEWGEAVITISPSHRPLNSKTIPYHKNIVIANNVFKVFDAPLVRARSVDRLHFTGNQVIKTYTYKPYTWQKSAFLLDGCRNVVIRDNQLDPAYTTRKVLIEHMRKSDVTVSRQEGYSIDFVKNLNTYQTW